MPRETTIKLEFALEKIPDTPATPYTLTGAGITKSATAGAVTTVLLDSASAPTVAPAKGDFVYIAGSGWATLDNKLHIVSAYDATGHTLSINTDTFAEAGTLGTVGDIKVSPVAFDHACLSEFSTNPGSPGEVDATTMCDEERVNLPGLSSPGTASFTGMFDMDDAGMNAFIAAESDGKPRWLVAKTRRGQMAAFHGVVSAFSMGALGVEQAVTFTGSFTLDRAPIYLRLPQ
jgi:hypothetical protein